jgi:UDP-N-acetylmuramate dehydrogenase
MSRVSSLDQLHAGLAAIPTLQVTRREPLSRHTRFQLGGPAALYAEAANEDALLAALRTLAASPLPWILIGEGANLLPADAGYRGTVLRYTAASIRLAAPGLLDAQAGATLEALVDYSLHAGLAGLEKLTRIPGSLGAAVYGNAGAYGASFADIVESVRAFDLRQVVVLSRDECEFRYRSSLFKQRRLSGRPLILLSARLRLAPGDPAALQAESLHIRETRDAKYPPDMRCAGSIFKNLLLADLPLQARDAVPPDVVKGGKVPAGWFLEQVGAKCMTNGGIAVAEYHANLVYNTGRGTAAQARELIEELRRRIQEKFGITLEEEVQFMGFEESLPGADQLAATPHILQGILAGVEPAVLTAQPAPGRWSIAQVLAHLAHCERNCFLLRLRRFLAEEEEEPAFLSYQPDEDPLASVSRFALAALDDFLAARRDSLDALASTPSDALEKTALHQELGRITLAQMLNEWAFHDLGHIRQIAEIVRALKYYPHMGPYQPLYEVKP